MEKPVMYKSELLGRSVWNPLWISTLLAQAGVIFLIPGPAEMKFAALFLGWIPAALIGLTELAGLILIFLLTFKWWMKIEDDWRRILLGSLSALPVFCFAFCENFGREDYDQVFIGFLNCALSVSFAGGWIFGYEINRHLQSRELLMKKSDLSFYEKLPS